ncbi:hypothetical protein C8Q70DRAFT_316754 [Cubamyces menziesii]|nr:hypothetical protein C8Q70DRAFT_316754 [Cubamyces menziesii]
MDKDTRRKFCNDATHALARLWVNARLYLASSPVQPYIMRGVSPKLWFQFDPSSKASKKRCCGSLSHTPGNIATIAAAAFATSSTICSEDHNCRLHNRQTSKPVLMSPTTDNLASGTPSYSHCWSACTSSKQGFDVYPARRQFLVEKSVADVIDTSEDEDVIPSRKPFRPTRYRQRNYLRSRDRVLLNVLSEGRSRWIHGEVCDFTQELPRVESDTHIIYPARWVEYGEVKVGFFDPHQYTILYDRYLSEFPERYALRC